MLMGQIPESALTELVEFFRQQYIVYRWVVSHHFTLYSSITFPTIFKYAAPFWKYFFKCPHLEAGKRERDSNDTTRKRKKGNGYILKEINTKRHFFFPPNKQKICFLLVLLYDLPWKKKRWRRTNKRRQKHWMIFVLNLIRNWFLQEVEAASYSPWESSFSVTPKFTIKTC